MMFLAAPMGAVRQTIRARHDLSTPLFATESCFVLRASCNCHSQRSVRARGNVLRGSRASRRRHERRHECRGPSVSPSLSPPFSLSYSWLLLILFAAIAAHRSFFLRRRRLVRGLHRNRDAHLALVSPVHIVARRPGFTPPLPALLPSLPATATPHAGQARSLLLFHSPRYEPGLATQSRGTSNLR